MNQIFQYSELQYRNRIECYNKVQIIIMKSKGNPNPCSRNYKTWHEDTKMRKDLK